MVPYLITFLDYPRSFDDIAIIDPATSFSLGNRRSTWPALDALIRIGLPAVPGLKQVVLSRRGEGSVKAAALSALNDISPEEAKALQGSLIQDLEQQGEKNQADMVRWFMARPRQ